MDDKIIIKTADDKELPVYLYEPSIAKKGAIVLIQEIFGVNNHIKSIGEKFAKNGYLVWIPEIYHRVGKNINLNYSNKDISLGKKYKEQAGWDLTTMDIISCIANLKVDHNVATIGFCYGGSLSWKSACLAYGLDAAICFYGSQIPDFLNKEPKCPTLIHLGEKDLSIDKNAQKKIIEFSKKCEFDIDIHLYNNADHGFFCDQRDSYNKEATELSYNRTLEFLEKYI